MGTELTMKESLEREKGMALPQDFSEETLRAASHRRNCVSALERQIPKKPAYRKTSQGDWFLEVYECQCPTCSRKWFAFSREKRCQECGQALDWQAQDE